MPRRLYDRPEALECMTPEGSVVYVALFDNGMVKVGSTTHPQRRLERVACAARIAFGVAMTDVQTMAAEHPRAAEKAALRSMRRVADRFRHTREYFTGITYQFALEVVRAALPA